MKPKNPPILRKARSGFSLIIVIALMVLLSLLAVGLLSLSTVSLRSSRGGDSMAEARSNARMALMVAIGNLQKSMGPDQRISANSSAINGQVGEPNVLGAWKSWHWNPEISDSPDYGEKKDGFVRWLVSTLDDEASSEVRTPSIEFKDPVWLVNPETVGLASGVDVQDGPSLRAERQRLNLSDDKQGGMAWAVMDESQKAAIGIEAEEDREMDKGERIAQRIAPQRPSPEVFLPAMDDMDNSRRGKMVSMDSAALALGSGSTEEVLGRQNSITTQSIGLMTNVADGGVKWDLTALLDGGTNPATELGRDTLYFTAAEGAPTWEYIQSHYDLQERAVQTSSGSPQISLLKTELRPAARGIDVSPTTERLMPVIAKMQIVFSIVSHHTHIGSRVDFYNTRATPRGNNRYAVPHLVYDPVVTLWNPYDVAIELDQLRVRFWDPPVLFAFEKNGAWLRPEFASGQYHGMGRYQIANERTASARKEFTMLLTDARGGTRPGAPIKLLPGEVKVFSPWVENDWTWDKETAGNPKAFFDWDRGRDFGNVDGRTGNKLGIETIPGWNQKAGLQTDHLSYSSGRPENTKYSFEKGSGVGEEGWVNILLSDQFGVHCKPGRALPSSGASRNEPDFKIDILAGVREQPERDIIRTYQFRFSNPEAEIGSTLRGGEIYRNYRVGDLLQTPTDSTAGGKTPFALFTVGAKTTKDTLDFSKPWMHAHPVNEGGEQDTRYVGNALDAYDVTLQEMSGFTDFPTIEIDPETKRGFLGGTSYSNGGVSNVPMFHVPVLPAASLGDLVNSNLVASGALPRFTHPFGNSYSHPLIPTDRVSYANPVPGTVVRFSNMLDHSYLLNDALWDRFFFSSIGDFQNDIVGNESAEDLLGDLLSGNPRQLNKRLVPIVSGGANSEALASEIGGLSSGERARRIATVLGVPGAFNVNSDSKEAWWAILTSLRDREVLGWGNSDLTAADRTAYPRSSFPLSGDSQSTSSDTSVDVAGAKRWAGFRALDDSQLEALAESIVDEIRQRGDADQAPFLTLAEFVNRRVSGGSGLHTVKGLLQTAIEESGVNAEFHSLDSNSISGSSQLPANATKGEVNAAARLGFSAEGAPSIVSQGDLMTALAPVATVRGDTFRIRAYGESRDKSDKVEATAWCEAVVQRIPEYVDPVDEADVLPDALESEVNEKFGRRFVLTSFRWLSAEEI